MPDKETVQTTLMKLLASKHFPFKPPRRKVKLGKLVAALKQMGTPTDSETFFENLCELKGRGLVNTQPKIIMKDEVDDLDFEVWLTPLGQTELGKKLGAT